MTEVFENIIFMRYTENMFKKNKPLISICIPVHNCEEYLERCLQSAVNQTFLQKEIIVVYDCSNNQGAKSEFDAIIKKFTKNYKDKITVIYHQENKGLLEARRSAIYAAKGKYVCLLDGDDTLETNALQILYDNALAANADIVQGKAKIVYPEEQKEKLQKIIQKKGEVANKVFLGELNEKEILDGFLIHHNHSGFLWGKLILKETYLNALNHIPPFFCTMCEDFLQYFFIAHEAKKYIGIENIVYDYSITSGISSNQTIYSLDRWMQVCSSASVFTTMLNELLYVNPLEYTTEQKDAVKIECRKKLYNNISQFSDIAPQIKDEAYKMMCDYWGEDFVHEVENDSKKAMFEKEMEDNKKNG